MTYIDPDQLKLILKGKPVETHTFLLTVKFDGGSMDNSSVWQPVFPESAKIIIALDDNILYNEVIDTEAKILNFDVVDSVDLREHTLRISLCNISRENFPVDLNPMLRIQGIWIENLNTLNLVDCLEQQGTYYQDSGLQQTGGPYMGCNGYQEIKFNTPIYRWLLDNHP